MPESQKIIEINLKDLVLWTENPRDPIEPAAKDQAIVDKAIEDNNAKWSLPKLAKEMGPYYDLSELPTVVYHGKKPVVYDGNRRIILGKIKYGFVKVADYDITTIPDFPQIIPCNVCTQKIALQNVYRKHGESGSWRPLERDIFLHRFLGQPKSTFLVLEDNTGLITARPDLNHVFVKNEIFKDDILKELGFEIKSDKLYSIHDDKQAATILSDVAQKIEGKKITTRINRGKVLDVLDKRSMQLIDRNRDNAVTRAKVSFSKLPAASKQLKQAKRTSKKDETIFGGKLFLKMGEVSDLYRDVADLYDYYCRHKAVLSQSFPGLIRMALRLLCETAAKDMSKSMDNYLSAYFATAKGNLSQDLKTLLSTQNVKQDSIVQLLHTGAHSYKSTSNVNQTIAISIILGEILKISHGQEAANS